MAIAGIYVSHAPQDQESVSGILGSFSQIVEISRVDEAKAAAVLEMPGHELTTFLKKLSSLPPILSLELIFVNYEDDLDAEGYMRTPPEAQKND